MEVYAQVCTSVCAHVCAHAHTRYALRIDVRMDMRTDMRAAFRPGIALRTVGKPSSRRPKQAAPARRCKRARHAFGDADGSVSKSGARPQNHPFRANFGSAPK